MAGRMGDHERQRHGGGRKLRGDAAGPEDGDLAGANGDGVAVLRLGKVLDPDLPVIVITGKVNKYVTAIFSLQLINERLITPRTQVKEIIALGLSYTIF